MSPVFPGTLVLAPSGVPSSPVKGQMYFDSTTNTLLWWDGTTWQSAKGGTVPDATATVKGVVQLAGDLTGTAAAPAVANGAITSAKILDGTITDVDVAAANKDGAVGTPSMRTLTTQPNLSYSTGQALAGNVSLDQILHPAAAWTNNSQRILGVADPTGAQDAATKNYVDTQGLVQDEGVALTKRPALDFVGTGVTATDDSANNRTLVTIPGGGGGGAAATMAARAYRNGALSFSSAGGLNKIPLDTLNYDTSGMYSSSNGRFVAPVAGYYQVDGAVLANGPAAGASTSFQAVVEVNGAVVAFGNRFGSMDSYGFIGSTVTDVIKLNAGDYVELFIQTGPFAFTIFQASNYTYLALALISSISTTAAPVTTARAYRNAALSLPATTWTKIAVDTISYDPGGNLSLASGRYVCPATGYYQVNACLTLPAAMNSQSLVSIYKNGAEAARGNFSAASGPTSSFTASDVISCNAGDYIEMWGYSASGQAVNVGASFVTFLSVAMVGTVNQTPAATALARMCRVTAYTSVAAAWTKFPFDAVNYDTSGATQVANSRFICPVAGYYQVNGGISAVSTATGQRVLLTVYRNGAIVSGSPENDSSAAGQGPAPTIADIIQCNAGDYLELYYYTSAALTVQVSSTLTYLSVALLSALPGAAGPITVARAYRNAAFTLPNTSFNKIPLDTISFDSGARFDLVNGRYVCPATGAYQVDGSMEINNPGTMAAQVGIAKNGTIVAEGGLSTGGAAGYGGASVSDIIQCNAGDYLELWGLCTTAGTAINNQAQATFMSVTLVGNSMNFSAASGDLRGTYPSPSVAMKAVQRTWVGAPGASNETYSATFTTIQSVLTLTITPTIPIWWEIYGKFALVQKVDAAYNYMTAILTLNTPDQDGIQQGMHYVTQHSAVQTYEAYEVKRMFRLAAGTTYTATWQLSPTGGSWQFYQGRSQTYLEAKAWAQ